MTHHSLSLIVGWIAVIPATVMSVAQLRRLRASTAGVSVPTWAFLLCFNVWITTYGAILSSAPLLVTGLSSALLQVWVLTRCSGREVRRHLPLAAGATLAAIALPALAWGISGAVAGAMSIALALRGPQIVSLLRSTDASGVAVSTWVVAALNNLLWAAYGVAVGQAVFAFFQSAMLVASVVVAVLATSRQRAALLPSVSTP